MKIFKSVFTISIILVLSSSIFAQEKNQNLYRVYPKDFKLIKNIEKTGVNVFNSSIDNFIDVIATNEQIKHIENEIGSVEFLANSFKELVDRRLKSGFYENYHNHQQTIDLLKQIADAFPQITLMDTIGYSNLGREICSIKISDNPDVDEDETPILMVGNHHGNEILSVEATLYQIDFLVNNYGIDAEVTNWIDNMEIWYVPMLNPDGREDIRRTNDNGIDLNRNYSFEHTAEGNHGPYGFSEPETQAIRDLAALYPPVMSLTYHTSGRLVLLPWTHTDEAAPDSLVLTYLGNKIAESITFPDGSGTDHYELRQGGDWYFTAGEYCDYMYATHNTFAYTVEMWTSQSPPSDVIPQVVERNLEGMKTLLRQAERSGVTGRITGKISGLALVANINFPDINDQGKISQLLSDPTYGRFYKYLVPGVHNIEISASGYRTINREITISDDGMFNMDLEMDPAPELQLREFVLSDESGNRISGNGDGLINIGETPGVLLTLYNDQQISAEGSFIKVSSSSSYINLITDSLYFGPIAHFSEVQSTDTLLFKLHPDCPDEEILTFHLDISDEISFAWKGEFALEAYTPNVEIEEIVIRDEDGNGNGIIDKGENVMLGLRLINNGRQGISEVISTSSITDPFFSTQTESVEISELNINESAFVEFHINLSDQAPNIYSSYLSLDLLCSEGYEASFQVPLNNIFGYKEDFENGINGWTHASYGTTSNNHDDWQLGQPQGKAGDPSNAFSGSNCWGTDLGFELYLGDSWNGEYQNDVHNYLLSPPIDCSDMIDVGLRYKRWLNTRASDIARIFVNDEQVWKSSNRGHSDLEWVEQLIDISEIADGNPEVRVKFELQSSSSNALGGWNLDDFLLANKLASGAVSSKPTINNQNIDLLRCYPNPFSLNTNINYELESSGYVELVILNTLGQIVKTLVSESQLPGTHSIQWDGKNQNGTPLDQGIYFVRLQSTTKNISHSIILAK